MHTDTVAWLHFNHDAATALSAAKYVAGLDGIPFWYVGVTRWPVRRMHGIIPKFVLALQNTEAIEGMRYDISYKPHCG